MQEGHSSETIAMSVRIERKACTANQWTTTPFNGVCVCWCECVCVYKFGVNLLGSSFRLDLERNSEKLRRMCALGCDSLSVCVLYER